MFFSDNVPQRLQFSLFRSLSQRSVVKGRSRSIKAVIFKGGGKFHRVSGAEHLEGSNYLDKPAGRHLSARLVPVWTPLVFRPRTLVLYDRPLNGLVKGDRAKKETGYIEARGRSRFYCTYQTLKYKVPYECKLFFMKVS